MTVPENIYELMQPIPNGSDTHSPLLVCAHGLAAVAVGDTIPYLEWFDGIDTALWYIVNELNYPLDYGIS